MSDLIDRQAAIDAVMRLSLGETDAVRLAMRSCDYLERMPSAQPEIIRCKDCTRYEKKRGCNLVEGLNVATENCFCSYAEVEG